MNEAQFDVVGVGNAIVDVISQADDDLIKRHSLPRGGMTLVDRDTSRALHDDMGPATEVSGGSAANTMAGLASLGGRAAFFGRVCDDQLGHVFTHDIRAIGVSYETPPAVGGAQTGRCLVLVTPDAQRTMQTYLGSSAEFGPEDVDEAVIRTAAVTYLEGYLFDPPPAKAAFRKAAEAAHSADRQVALTLSDSFCVARHQDEFRDLVDGHVDILFANEDEITILYGTSDFDAAIEAVRGKCGIAVLTRGEKGAVILAGEEMYTNAPEPVAQVIDTTGAGDLYAAGFLYGMTHGCDLPTCGRIAGICAAEIIGHFGARPAVSLKDLVAERLG